MTGNDQTVSPVTFVNPGVSSCVGGAVFILWCFQKFAVEKY